MCQKLSRGKTPWCSLMAIFVLYWEILNDWPPWGLIDWLWLWLWRFTDSRSTDKVCCPTSDWLMPVSLALCQHTGSGSPCNSDEENKHQNFIDKSTVLLWTLLVFYFHPWEWRRCDSIPYVLCCGFLFCVVLFGTIFPVKSKSRRFSKTVANDFGTVTSVQTIRLLNALSLPLLFSPLIAVLIKWESLLY